MFSTYETKFELFWTKRRQYVQIIVGEHVRENCLNHTVKLGGGNVMIWDNFGGWKVGDLVQVINSRAVKKMYHGILLHHAALSGTSDIVTFQQDNGQKHASKLLLNYLKTKDKQKALKIIICPPQSPDLNLRNYGRNGQKKVWWIQQIPEVFGNVCITPGEKKIVKHYKNGCLECQNFAKL